MAHSHSNDKLDEKDVDGRLAEFANAAEHDAHSDSSPEDLHDIEKTGPPKPTGPPLGAFNPMENPDGGRQAWLCVLGGFCTLFCSFGWVNTIGVFQEYYETHQLARYSAGQIAWIPSLEVFMNFFLGPVVGSILDNFGPRWLLLIGTFLHVFGLMMTSLCTEYWQFILAQGICSPIGICMVFFPAMGTLATWFLKKRALAFGIMASGSSLGGVVLPIMLQRLIAEVGFGWAIRITAFLILGLMIVANLTVTSRIEPIRKPVKLMEFLLPLKELPFDLITFGSFLFFLGFFIPINYSIAFAIDAGMSPSLAQYMLSLINAASLFGRILPGYLADKLGRFNTFVVMCFFTSILILAMWIPSRSNAPIIVFNLLYGFGSGAFISTAPSVIAQISDVRKIGVRTGTYFACISIAALVSNPIGGALLTRWDGGYLGLQIFSGIMTMAGATSITLARVRVGGWRLWTKV